MPLWQITGLSPAFLRVNKVLHIRLIQDRQSLVSGRSLIILRWSFIISVTDLFSFTYFIRLIFNAYLRWISWLHEGHLLLLVLNCPIRFASVLLKEYGSYLSYSVPLHCALAAVFQQLFRLVLDFFQSHGLYCTSCSIHIPICYLFHLKGGSSYLGFSVSFKNSLLHCFMLRFMT